MEEKKIFDHITIQGSVHAIPGSPGGNSKWGNISGDIHDQEDLINELNKKENTDIQKSIEFFESRPEFDFRFAISIANKPIDSVTELIELILNEFRLHAPIAWIPFDIGKMCLIIKVNSSEEKEAFRLYIPKTGQLVSVSLIDPSGLVKFTYYTIGDSTKWGSITGNIEEQTDLGETFLDNKSKIKKSEIEDLFG